MRTRRQDDRCLEMSGFKTGQSVGTSKIFDVGTLGDGVHPGGGGPGIVTGTLGEGTVRPTPAVASGRSNIAASCFIAGAMLFPWVRNGVGW